MADPVAIDDTCRRRDTCEIDVCNVLARQGVKFATIDNAIAV